MMVWMPNPKSTPVAIERTRAERVKTISRAAAIPKAATPTGSTANHKAPLEPLLNMEIESRPLPAGTRRIGSAQAQTIRPAPTAATATAASLSPLGRPGLTPGRSAGPAPGPVAAIVC